MHATVLCSCVTADFTAHERDEAVSFVQEEFSWHLDSIWP